MRAALIWSLFSLVWFDSNQTSAVSLNKANSWLSRLPHSILTPHYGILSEADLLLDFRTYTPGRYEPHVTGHSFWQCFPIPTVLIGYDKSRDADPMGPADAIVTMCSLEIKVREKGNWNDYWARRGLPIEFCEDLASAFKKLTQGEHYVCFNGEPAGLETKWVDGKKHQIRGWVWNKFKTRKGCYSYFEGACPSDSK